ncbi:stretch-activated Ca2+-permeable channel component-domain-containing protein [Mycena rebaudengoi]|nr:stretch-activated Ca2+-permeable channel component-domain-containing protein [Mycena rebaudengoi]
MAPTDRISMLPATLLLLLNAAIAVAQTRQLLAINSVVKQQAPNPPFFTIPSGSQLAVSIAVCSGAADSVVPRFFVTNSSSDASPGSQGGTDIFEIVVNKGHGNWTGTFPNGGVLGVEDANRVPFEIGLSNGIPIHEVVPGRPLLGDTTATQALLFSHALSPQSLQDPSYPNYTLPSANLSAPAAPSNFANLTLIVSPTSNGLATMEQAACMLLQQKSSGTIETQSLWLRNTSGWRSEWLVTGLTPKTNYTMYVIENSFKVSGPIYFVTKSSSFSCSLVSQLPYCPSIAYAVPLPAPPAPRTAYTSATLPESITKPLLSSLTNFTTVLTTFACGRDFYSPLVSCADCQRAYRTWLCAISFPPLRRLRNRPTFCRAPAVPLLPCIETCTATDRACPNFLGFRCPLPRFNAAESYGVGFIDSGIEGVQGGGTTGAWSDDYGNVWCSSGH